jgi:hypothetical protein
LAKVGVSLSKTSGRLRSGHRFPWPEACLLAATLLLSTAITLSVSRVRILERDELFAFWTDSLPSVRRLLDIQLHDPISLDPPVYHLLSHAAMSLLGRGDLALRLPAIAGYLLLQIALFALVSRIAGRRAGILAATLPAFTEAFPMAMMGRPYTLLLGLDAAALLCWQIAKTTDVPSRRTLAQCLLFVSLVLVIHVHFFGLLILAPICAAEAVDSLTRRRIDPGTLTAILLGVLSTALLLPFIHAVAPYRQFYWSRTVRLTMIQDAYRFMLFGYTPVPGQWHLPLLYMLALALLLVASTVVALRHRETVSAALWTAVLTLSFLPVFGYLLARYGTHSVEPRHVMAALVALPIMIGVLLGPHLTRARFVCLMLPLLVLESVQGIATLRKASPSIPAFVQWYGPSPAVTAALASRPGQPIATTDLGLFLLSERYIDDPIVRDRLTLVYDRQRELHWTGQDTGAVTSMNLRHDPRFHVAPFSTVLAPSGQLVQYDDFYWDWTLRELNSEGRTPRPLVVGLGGTVATVPPLAIPH